MRFDQNAALPPILHLTFFNPLDDHYGQSPLEAAAIAVDTHNAVACWNKALLDNAARPSGALVYAGADGGVLSPVQYERLKKEFTDFYQGANNAGRPLVLDGGLDWRPISLSPRDMDFLEAKHASACEIALAFGVPPMLLGIPGDNTYRTIRKPTGCSGVRACCRSRRALAARQRIGCRQSLAKTSCSLPIRGDAMGTPQQGAVSQRRPKTPRRGLRAD